jgi:hypothetical protein
MCHNMPAKMAKFVSFHCHHTRFSRIIGAISCQATRTLHRIIDLAAE